ncbi:hypothetical protein FEK31_22060 [Nocardia cyriacigeorgica]|nr:hypothetical protein FEK31_22060 [Nocardia cyriacigeorgica]
MRDGQVANRPNYTAVNAAAARAALDELTERWGTRCGAIVCRWNNAWEEFIVFLDYDFEIRRVICSTNAIESLITPATGVRSRPEDVPHRAGRP